MGKVSKISKEKSLDLNDSCTLDSVTLSGIEDIYETKQLDVSHLGGKGLGCAVMANEGFKVPEALVIPTDWCLSYLKNKSAVMKAVKERTDLISEHFNKLNKNVPGALVSVRSGAAISMPGMMDTVLNVGMSKENVKQWGKLIGERGALDCYRRLQQMFGSVVYKINSSEFEEELSSIKKKYKVKLDSDLSEKALAELIDKYEEVYSKSKKQLPQTLGEQLIEAIEAVFLSWNNERAKKYREINKISDDLGTAVVIQRMIFGNINDLSGSGVLFTRNPATGQRGVMGEFLPCAQGEDVVSGVRTPLELLDLKEMMPAVYEELVESAQRLEKHYKDVQDIEFTIENEKLYILQVRSAKRSAVAALKIALDMVAEGLIEKRDVPNRFRYEDYQALNAPMIAPGFNRKSDVEGLAASTGIATGEAVFSSRRAVALAAEGKNVILISEETTPDDLPGMYAAVGILTATGGVTSHAAVVARGMNKVCVVGASGMKLNYDHKYGEKRLVSVSFSNGKVLKEGEVVTIDGASGRTWCADDIPIIEGAKLPQLQQLHDLLFDVYPIYRIALDGRELHSDYKMIYATYGLDGLSDSTITNEIQESLPYLNGILDLTCASDYYSESDRKIANLMCLGKNNRILDVKIDALKTYYGDKSGFSVYVGEHFSKYENDLKQSGYNVCVALPKVKSSNVVRTKKSSESAYDETMNGTMAMKLLIDKEVNALELKSMLADKSLVCAVSEIEKTLLTKMCEKIEPKSEDGYQSDERVGVALSVKGLAKSVLLK